MTIMTSMEAKREMHRDQVSELIPDANSCARLKMEDLQIPAEADALGLQDREDVIGEVLDFVLSELDAAPVPKDAEEFVEEAKFEAKHEIPVLVEEEFTADWL